jgi:dTDP-4-dehydrorhamnose 3,5-epimerase-like enzyme
MKLINHSDQSVIKDLFIVSIESFKDHRGENFEGFNDKKYEDIFSQSAIWKQQNPKFIIDSFSKSTYSVLRGFHGDLKTWKLMKN